MAVITGLIILGGVTILASAGIAFHEAGEKARADEQKKKLQAVNQQLAYARDKVSTMQTKLIKAKEYLNNAKTAFKKGGHVQDGVPIANTEFIDCINKLDAAITNATNFINDCNETIKTNENTIKTNDANIKASHDRMVQANKEQHARRDGALSSPKPANSNSNSNKPKHR